MTVVKLKYVWKAYELSCGFDILVKKGSEINTLKTLKFFPNYIGGGG